MLYALFFHVLILAGIRVIVGDVDEWPIYGSTPAHPTLTPGICTADRPFLHFFYKVSTLIALLAKESERQ